MKPWCIDTLTASIILNSAALPPIKRPQAPIIVIKAFLLISFALYNIKAINHIKDNDGNRDFNHPIWYTHIEGFYTKTAIKKSCVLLA